MHLSHVQFMTTGLLRKLWLMNTKYSHVMKRYAVVHDSQA